MYNQDRTQILDRRVMLKIKIKSLAAESKMIRREELKEKEANRAHRMHTEQPTSYVADSMREELYRHRVDVVRPHCRLAHLAYGLIRGKTRQQMEAKSPDLSDNDKKQIKEMIRKYGPRQGFVLPDFLTV